MKKTNFLIFLAFLGVATIFFIVLNFNYFVVQYRYRTGGVVQAPMENSPQEQQEVKLNPNELSIPSLGISSPVQEVDVINELEFQKALQNGVVHYPGTAKVGDFGNAYIFGHSSDLALARGNFKTVFALLPQIEIGGDIFVSNSAGETFQYQVISKSVIEKNDLSVLGQNDLTQKILSLQTSYPLGTALKRYLVIAKLVE